MTIFPVQRQPGGTSPVLTTCGQSGGGVPGLGPLSPPARGRSASGNGGQGRTTTLLRTVRFVELQNNSGFYRRVLLTALVTA